jgi:hypothetical protein
MNALGNIIKEVLKISKTHLKEEIFLNLFKIMHVAIIILPISSATYERSFSAMRSINTYVRTNMTQDRFTNLAILNIEKDITVNIEILY